MFNLQSAFAFCMLEHLKQSWTCWIGVGLRSISALSCM